MISKGKFWGELIASELEQLGFTTIKDYSDLNKAVTLTQGSDSTKIFMACIYRSICWINLIY